MPNNINSTTSSTSPIAPLVDSINIPLLADDNIKLFDINGSLIDFKLIRRNTNNVTLEFDKILNQVITISIISSGILKEYTFKNSKFILN